MKTQPIEITSVIKQFKPVTHDWKQLYYALALRVVAAKIQCDHEKFLNAHQELVKAVDAIFVNERAIEIGNTIPIFVESEIKP